MKSGVCDEAHAGQTRGRFFNRAKVACRAAVVLAYGALGLATASAHVPQNSASAAPVHGCYVPPFPPPHHWNVGRLSVRNMTCWRP